MKKITEKDKDIIDQWYVDAKRQTKDSIDEFIRHISEDYEHDYGTICHACAAGAMAGLYAVETSPQGGITGFQAGAIQWEIIKAWGAFGSKDAPMAFIDYSNMLYPQYESKFKSISKATWEWLQKEANIKLAEGSDKFHPDIYDHIHSIAAGKVPFGYTVKE